uniref:Ovulation stimulating substance n=2 Tax=Drosophila biarmipes TaxID=125945 RepID=Q7M464_DROBM
LNKSDPAFIKGEQDRKKWCRLNLGPAWGGRTC